MNAGTNTGDTRRRHAAHPVVHPNELDRRRIERALAKRERYRYVSPSVDVINDGYLIRSPCCSRNVDPEGGVVDIALLYHVHGPRPWRLYSRLHEKRQWLLHATFDRLSELLEELKADPQRVFWR